MPQDIILHFDKVREEWVLLASSRAVTINSVGHAVLSEIDGQKTFGQIAELLTHKFDASQNQISEDTAEFLEALKERNFLNVVASQ